MTATRQRHWMGVLSVVAGGLALDGVLRLGSASGRGRTVASAAMVMVRP